MNASETPWIQSRLEMMHPLAKKMGLPVDVALHVVVVSFNPEDLRNPNEKDSTGVTDRQSVEGWGQFLQLPLTDSRLGALERSIKSLIIEGFEQVIGCRRIEGAKRMLIVRGDEDHGRGAFCFHPVEKLKSAEPGQVDVEKQAIRVRW